MSMDQCHAGGQQHRFNRCGAPLPANSAAQTGSDPISSWREHYMLFGSTCDSDLSNLSQSESCLNAGLLTAESYFATPPPSPTRPSTSTACWATDLGGATRPPPQQNAKDRKERRRAQNRVAQRAFRERKEKAIVSLRKELERVVVINQGLIVSNEAYARQISELKKTIESVKLLEASPPSSGFAYGMPFDLDTLEPDHGFTEGIPSLGEKMRNGTNISIESEPPVPAFGPFQHQSDNLSHFHRARGEIVR